MTIPELLHTGALALGKWSMLCIGLNAAGFAAYVAMLAVAGIALRAFLPNTVRKLVEERAYEKYGCAWLVSAAESAFPSPIGFVASATMLPAPFVVGALCSLAYPCGVLMVLADEGFMNRARRAAKVKS